MSNGGPQTLSNQDIIGLVGAALGSSIIIGAIIACPQVKFSLDVAGLTALAQAKVPPEVISAMQSKQAQQPG